MKLLTLRLALGAATLAACLGVTLQQTDGLRVLTSAREPAVRALEHPRFEAPLRTADDRLVTQLPGAGALRVVEIMFERCNTVCASQAGVLTSAFRALQHDVRARRLHFVSLSVDADDCPTGGARRWRRLAGSAAGWDGVCVRDDAARARLARQIGLVALRDDRLGWRHTEGVFLVNADGHVLAHEPASSAQSLVLTIQRTLSSGAGDG